MARISIMEGLGRIEGLVDPMDVPWARSFFEEGMEKGIEKGIEKERLKFIRFLFKRGMPMNEIAEAAEVSEEYVRTVVGNPDGATTHPNGAV